MDRERDAGDEVVVGYDASAVSQRALDWALSEAAVRGLRLRVLTVSERGLLGSPDSDDVEHCQAAAERALEEAGVRVPGGGGVAACVEAVGGSPRRRLLEASRVAGEVVVGRRGSGGLGALRMGSVTTALLHHAAGPVVVVPEGWQRRPDLDAGTSPGGRRPVVVGTDGSAPARRALRWAARHADLRGLPLHVVVARQEPLSPYAVATAAYGVPVRDLAAEADRVLADARREVEEGPWSPPLCLRQEVTTPARALLDAARTAELLVVGARGLGGFAGLLLGSVSEQAARHAPCPVAVVAGARADETGAPAS